jgi:hypothetical protein
MNHSISKGGKELLIFLFRNIFFLFYVGFYTALCIDKNGLLLAGKCEKDGNAHIEIYDNQGHLLRIIDSYTQRLRRPCSLTTTRDGCLLCVDLTTDSVRKYRYT